MKFKSVYRKYFNMKYETTDMLFYIIFSCELLKYSVYLILLAHISLD